MLSTADLEPVFDGFTRLDEARPRTRANGGGSGLGLAITRQIARRHHGDAAGRGAGQASFMLTCRSRRRHWTRRSANRGLAE